MSGRIPNRSCGRPPRSHRRVLDAVFWLMRTGAPWRDLPEEFGNWNSIFRQFPALGRQRHLGCDPGGARRQRRGRRDIADDRCDHRARASLRRRRKGGAERNALGRSRGGFSTKINAAPPPKVCRSAS